MAKVAFIGDSYTVGVGDGRKTANESVALCGAIQPMTYPNWIDWPAHFEPGTGWPAVRTYGYIPKLMYFLRANRPDENHQIAGLSCMNGANSDQAVAHGCAAKVNGTGIAATHTFIFLGINDIWQGIPAERTRSNVASLLNQVNSTYKYCIGGMPADRYPDGVQIIYDRSGGAPWKTVPPDAPPPPPRGYNTQAWPGSACSGHPNQSGYLHMAAAVYWAVHDLNQW